MAARASIDPPGRYALGGGDAIVGLLEQETARLGPDPPVRDERSCLLVLLDPGLGQATELAVGFQRRQLRVTTDVPRAVQAALEVLDGGSAGILLEDGQHSDLLFEWIAASGHPRVLISGFSPLW